VLFGNSSEIVQSELSLAVRAIPPPLIMDVVAK
jgi:hypothetical protein